MNRMMTKSDLQCKISMVVYDIEDFKAAMRLATDSDLRKEINNSIETAKKLYIELRAKLDNGEYEEDEDDWRELHRQHDLEKNARIKAACASCTGSY